MESKTNDTIEEITKSTSNLIEFKKQVFPPCQSKEYQFFLQSLPLTFYYVKTV